METTPKKPRNIKLTLALVMLLVLASLIAGIAGYYITNPNSSNNQGASNPLTQASPTPTASTQTSDNNSTDTTSLSQIYQQVEPSVVVVQDWQPSTNVFNQASYSQVQGSGFTYSLNGQYIIITNFHVVDSAVNVTVTFQDGDTYTAKVLGSDAYSDLAVLSTEAPQSELVPLTIISSSGLLVGDQVIAIGSPYGLTGSMTTGIISALNRTITEGTTNGYAISDIIQTSTAINPGNSGGPLLNSQGQVIGITTAIVDNSQGLGFAIPSDTILREIQDLAQNGSYNKHPLLGLGSIDMTYDIATQMKATVTYGVLVQQVTSGGPADKAGVKAGTTQAVVDGNTVNLGGDIIVGINGNRIRNSDDLSTYLEAFTHPGQTINLTVIRNGQSVTLSVVLGTRPPPTTGTSA